MRVSYKGQDKDFEYRLAEIGYEDDEETVMKRIEQEMNKRGWNLNIVADGYASCVVDDREEYKAFVEDYKQVKRMVKQ